MKYSRILFCILIALFFGEHAETKNLRVISTAPNITEIIYALGAQDLLVGVSSYCNYPEEAKLKEKVGTFSRANMEKILSLNPDIVFTTDLEQEIIIKQLNDLGIKNITVDPKNSDELYREVLNISRILGVTKKGRELIEKLKKELRDIQKKIPEGRKPKVMIELYDNPLMVAGKGSFVENLIKLAGGENIAYDTPRPYSRFSPELVVKRNPDCIILAYMQKGSIRNIYKRSGWSGINAIKSKKVFDDIDPDLLLRPGPRFVMGVKKMYERLYEK